MPSPLWFGESKCIDGFRAVLRKALPPSLYPPGPRCCCWAACCLLGMHFLFAADDLA